jgi:thiosulfate/3-mercaptopyruvate sulfurtransferase
MSQTQHGGAVDGQAAGVLIDPKVQAGAQTAGYASPEVLVTTDWVAAHLKDPRVKVVEVDVDPKLYDAGHIAGAVGWDWNKELQDQVTRDIPSKEQWEALLSRSGISPEDTLVLYGDASNWFAAYAFWVAKHYGHRDVRLINGGRVKWLNESDKAFVTERPTPTPTTYKVSQVHPELRARLPEVLELSSGSRKGQATLVDVRSPDEFSGKVIAPPGMTESAQRGGHIPGAKSIPWGTAVNQDGTFKTIDELRQIYLKDKGVDAGKEAVAYCRIGERSSHTWFVLKYLLGLKDVRNYDGSWTEYGSVIGVPIER